ncbi:MAG TPA: CDP-diacylglycerol--glycerol-3-phosphate 3-phosphatidyltransferase [Steroidobacteraceae bacterium]|nr:CDP-diacylglycerol--glycerol-3-phosphate 3-phosphatidyltransferase [Steroidobacteraceae bacterium]
MNLPNLLTWMRILAIPLIVVLFFVGAHHPQSAAYPVAGLTFAAAAITDSLDGYLARRLGQITPLGTFLDPVADKLIVAVALVLIVSRDPNEIVVLMGAVIIGREIAISALREWMAGIGQRTTVAVSRMGKLKTILQMVGLTMLLYRSDLIGLPIYQMGLWLTVVAAILTLISMGLYLRAAWPHLSARS